MIKNAKNDNVQSDVNDGIGKTAEGLMRRC